MEIDVKGVGAFVWTMIRVSTNTTFIYVKKYPLVFGVSTFIFLLYTFLPLFFYFLLCSSPFLAFAASYLRHHINWKPLKIGNSTKEEKTDNDSSWRVRKGSGSGDDMNQKADLRHEGSVRRNARRKVEEMGKDWDSLQASEEETEKVILTTLYGELPDTRTQDDFGKFKRHKKILAAEEESIFDEAVVIEPIEKNVTSGDGETEVEISSSSSEEESREDKNQAVAWTEDDQKNLMELGFSEIERNKRLDNLIARRRTRRLFVLAAEGSLRDMGTPSIRVQRNYFGIDQDNYDIDELQMPSSAPSVLLPRRNPFDLPYDPQEERPNLLADSFQQEFAAGNHKDMLFSRHESFCRGIFPLEIQQDYKWKQWRQVVDGRSQQDRRENMDSGLGHGNDICTETGHVNDDREKNIIDVSKQTNSKPLCRRNGDHIGNSLAGLVPRSNMSSSLGAERQKYMEHFGYSTRKGHSVTHSVDSDLHVEFSEIGSPPTTVDWNNSSDEEESLSVYETEAGKDMGFDTEPNNSMDTSEKFEEFTKNTALSISGSLADEMKMSYESDEPEPSEITDGESQGHNANYNEEHGDSEMRGVMETEALDDDNGNSYESAHSPKSVLPEVLPQDQTFVMNSEDMETVNAAPADEHIDQAEEEAGGDENSIGEMSNVENENFESQGTIEKKQEDCAVTVSEESNVDDMENSSNDKLKSAVSSTQLKLVQNENVDSSETIRDNQSTVMEDRVSSD